VQGRERVEREGRSMGMGVGLEEGGSPHGTISGD
jgi:hypothetical protein